MNLSHRHLIPIDGGYPVRASAWRLLVACLVVPLLAAGCDGSEPSSSTSAPPTSPPASPTAVATPSNAADGAPTAMDAYRDMWRAYVQAIHIPDPAYPSLARYSQGDALNVWVKGVTSVQQQGLVGQGDVSLSPAVKTANPNAAPPTVEIKDCVDTSTSHLVKKDGSPYRDTPGGRRSATAIAACVGAGVWKVTQIAIYGVGTC
jgi:hypothetical protein